MFAALVLATLVATGPALPPSSPMAVAAVPDEPGAFFLPEAPTYQAVAADLDVDGVRDVIRLVGGERGAIIAEAWADAGDAWRLAGAPVRVLPERPAGASAGSYADTPVRLIVRRVGSAERVTVVRQPRLEESDSDPECCLLLHDVVLSDGSLSLRSVADPGESVSAVSVLDFDGDGTDELLVSRSLPPQGDISYPTAARVYRWNGDAFGPQTATELPVGSGDTPFVLGDSDGRPGDEAAIISTLGRPGLFRIRLEADDHLAVDDAGIVATDARAVPIGDARGMAVIGPTIGLAVMPWPAGEEAADPVAQLPMSEGRLLGVVDILDEARLLVRGSDPEGLRVLGLPGLIEPRGGSVIQSPGAATFASSALAPYVGPLPGGGPDGEAAVIYAGRLVPWDERAETAFPLTSTALIGTLAGAEPIGFVGRERSWLAILHAPPSLDRTSHAGGRLDAPVVQAGSGVSLAPIEIARTPERGTAALEPELRDVSPLFGGELATAAGGFTATVVAPPGSRVYVAGIDPSVIRRVRVVPRAGQVDVRIAPPMVRAANDRYRGSLVVATPAGHAYVAGWRIRSLVVPPDLEATVSTTLGSPSVQVSGETAPYALVKVAGTEVPVDGDGRFTASVDLPPWPTDIRVVAADPVGNADGVTLSGVGLFDYRGLPWVPIVAALVAVAGLALFLRVPRSRPVRGRALDDAVLEELEPD